MTRPWLFVALSVLGLSASACSKATADAQSDVRVAAAATGNSNGNYAVTVDTKGFTPSSIALPKGKPASLVFTRTSDDTCAKDVVFPDLNVKKELPLNKPVTIEVPTTAARTLTFQCGMAMFKSTVIIN